MKFTNLYHEGHYQQLFQSYSRSIHFFKINYQKSTVKINEACASLHFENGGRRGEGSLSMKQHCKTTYFVEHLFLFADNTVTLKWKIIQSRLCHIVPQKFYYLETIPFFPFRWFFVVSEKLGWTCQISRNWEISQIFENRENLNFLATGTQCEKFFF